MIFLRMPMAGVDIGRATSAFKSDQQLQNLVQLLKKMISLYLLKCSKHPMSPFQPLGLYETETSVYVRKQKEMAAAAVHAGNSNCKSSKLCQQGNDELTKPQPD